MDYLSKLFTGLFKNKRGKRREEKEKLNLRIKQLEELLSEKEQAVDKAKQSFLRNIYHEIRTPLNAIVGFSDLIEMNSIDVEEKASYIAFIRESSKDFLRKMDNIVEASILEAGLLKLNEEIYALNDVLNEVYAFFSIQKHLAEKKIAFLLTVPKNTKDIRITCDQEKLSQILHNLISNAFKFTEQGVIEFGYSIKDKNIEFFVKDSGIGGLSGKEKKVFDSFSKIDDSDSSKEGLGLGLNLTKNLIELMEGKIWYESVKGEGTSFYFSIPFNQVYYKSEKETGKNKKSRRLLNRERIFKSSVAL